MKTGRTGFAQKSYGLSERELKILELLAEGETRGQIGSSLNISVHTVGTHLTNVYRKLGVRNQAQAVAKWLRHKLPPTVANVFC
ncbi:MAG: LuxR C-terminal-related transcriptional regulator [Bacteroidetes bacterium]|nr:LuxR C-terminal-related transcriptional regulator [Bacteroidota bacterium]